jgi:hypothetical protein
MSRESWNVGELERVIRDSSWDNEATLLACAAPSSWSTIYVLIVFGVLC